MSVEKPSWCRHLPVEPSRRGLCYKSRYTRLWKLLVRMVHEMNCHTSPQHMARSYWALRWCRFTAMNENGICRKRRWRCRHSLLR